MEYRVQRRDTHICRCKAEIIQFDYRLAHFPLARRALRMSLDACLPFVHAHACHSVQMVLSFLSPFSLCYILLLSLTLALFPSHSLPDPAAQQPTRVTMTKTFTAFAYNVTPPQDTSDPSKWASRVPNTQNQRRKPNPLQRAASWLRRVSRSNSMGR